MFLEFRSLRGRSQTFVLSEAPARPRLQGRRSPRGYSNSIRRTALRRASRIGLIYRQNNNGAEAATFRFLSLSSSSHFPRSLPLKVRACGKRPRIHCEYPKPAAHDFVRDKKRKIGHISEDESIRFLFVICFFSTFSSCFWFPLLRPRQATENNRKVKRTPGLRHELELIRSPRMDGHALIERGLNTSFMSTGTHVHSNTSRKSWNQSEHFVCLLGEARGRMSGQ